MVAGHTTDYVNAVLTKVAAGDLRQDCIDVVLTKVAAGDRTGGLTVED